MKTVLVSIIAMLFLLHCGVASAQKGRGTARGPSETAYEHADDRAKFMRDESASAAEDEEVAGTGKGKDEGTSVTGKGKNKEVKEKQEKQNTKTKEKRVRNKSKKGGKGKEDGSD